MVLLMTRTPTARQARQALHDALDDVVEQFGVWLELRDADELAYWWRIGVGEGERWSTVNWWVTRRLLPRGTPLVLCYRRPTYPRRLVISLGALDRIAEGETYLGAILASAVRQCVALMHNASTTGQVPVCVIAVLRPDGGTPAGSPGTLEFITDDGPPDPNAAPGGGAS